MAQLHDVLHEIVSRLNFPSEQHAADAHAGVDAIPEYVEQLVDEQLDAEQPADAGNDPEQEQTV